MPQEPEVGQRTKGSTSFTVASLVVPLLLVAALQLLPPTTEELLQGNWEGKGPAGRIWVTIEEDTLRFFARDDFWYEATFVVPAGKFPPELRATIIDSSPPTDGIGTEVIALLEIEPRKLTLGVDDGSAVAPRTFDDALSLYELRQLRPLAQD